MNVGDVVTALTVAGEFVGKLAKTNSSSVVLDDPRMLVNHQDGMGFAHGVCITGEQNPKRIELYSVVLVTKTNQEIEDAWREATSGLVMP